MKIKQGKEDWWQTGLENNQDFYGRGVYTFAERWANEMERIIDMGINPANAIVVNADECARKADTDGITGFMYGVAVGILSEVWEYGEFLRKWHNHEYNYDGEGVANPAILTIK
jgi:hypothetical protein